MPAKYDGQTTDSQNFAKLVTSKAREDDVKTTRSESVQAVADQRRYDGNDAYKNGERSSEVVTRSRKRRGAAPTDG